MMAGMTDVDQMRRLKTASKKLAERQIMSITSKQKLISPVETQNVALAKQMAQDEMNLLRTMDNVPDKVFELLDQYLFECDQLDQLANPPPPPAPPAPPGVVPGAAALGAPQPGPVPAMAAPPAPIPGVQ